MRLTAASVLLLMLQVASIASGAEPVAEFLGAIPDNSTEMRAALSADGQHVMVLVRQSDASTEVWLDGSERKAIGNVHCAAIDQDGSHFALSSIENSQEGVYEDGKVIGTFDAVGEPPKAGGLSHALLFGGGHLAFAARRGKEWTVITDEGPGASFDSVTDLTLSRNGRRTAYAAKKGGSSYCVIDGKISPPYLGVRDLRFSSDGLRFAYLAEASDGSWTAVIDGKPGPPCLAITSSVVFSNNSKYAGYAILNPDAARTPSVVIDGQSHASPKGPAGLLALSNNGQEVSSVVGSTGISSSGNHLQKYDVLIVDGVVDFNFSRINLLEFSPAGEHLACSVLEGANAVMFIDGHEGKRYDRIYAPTFSRDGAHLAYAALADGTLCMVIDHAEVAGFEPLGDAFVGSPVYQFDGNGDLAFVAKKGANIYKIKVHPSGESKGS